ncbi:peptide deformylase, partial [Campylobacter jejuni]|nr:peptide deformylase [Campylobacter jejuni]
MGRKNITYPNHRLILNSEIENKFDTELHT